MLTIIIFQFLYPRTTREGFFGWFSDTDDTKKELNTCKKEFGDLVGFLRSKRFKFTPVKNPKGTPDISLYDSGSKLLLRSPPHGMDEKWLAQNSVPLPPPYAPEGWGVKYLPPKSEQGSEPSKRNIPDSENGKLCPVVRYTLGGNFTFDSPPHLAEVKGCTS